jgi:arylformamidase
MTRRIHDITLLLSPELPVWPGDPPVELVRVSDLAAGDPFSLTRLSTSAHAGTHVDAPAHFLADGATVEALDLDALIGPALVLALPDLAAIDAASLDEALDAALTALGQPRSTGAERLLLRTANSQRRAQGVPEAEILADFVALTADGARWLVERGVRLVGIDGPSIAPLEDIDTPHRVLLGAGVVVVEGLDLARVAPGEYTLVCLPLKLAGADGAPARAVLVEGG